MASQSCQGHSPTEGGLSVVVRTTKVWEERAKLRGAEEAPGGGRGAPLRDTGLMTHRGAKAPADTQIPSLGDWVEGGMCTKLGSPGGGAGMGRGQGTISAQDEPELADRNQRKPTGRSWSGGRVIALRERQEMPSSDTDHDPVH